MAPIGPQGAAVEPAVLLEPTDKVPPVVTNPFQQSLRGIPGVKEDVLGATAEVIAGMAEQLQGEGILRGSTFAPEPYSQRHPKRPIGPYQQHQRKAVDGSTLLTGEHPRKPLNGRGKGFRNDRIVNDEIAALPREECAKRQIQECLPRPIGLQQSRQAVM